MRVLFAILATFLLAQCASSEDERFRVGESPRALVVIGIAEAAGNTEADYSMLWRRIGPDGRFEGIDENNSIEANTNVGGTVRIRGIPGEFKIVEVDPGTYALDSVFAVIHDRVNYIANGVVTGPERPGFEVRAGEAVYIGIWQLTMEETTAVGRLWRLDENDLRAVLNQSHPTVGGVRVREVGTRLVQCAPHRRNAVSQRQAC